MTATYSPAILRVVRPSEVDPAAVARVMNDAFKKYPFMVEERTNAAAVLEDAVGGELILAEATGRIVGCALVRASLAGDWLEATPDHRHPGSCYFGMAAVSRESQGMGVGRQLVARAEEIAVRGRFHRMLLTTNEEMGNVAYYTGLGYRSVSTHQFPAGHWGLSIPHTYHAMVKDLPLPLRQARPEEVESVTALVNQAYRVEDFFIDGNRTNVPEVARIVENDRFLVVDAPDGSLAGSVYVQLDGDRGYFGMLSVAPAHQRTGLGARLVGAVEDFCRKRGCTRMELTAVDLRKELPAWYAKLGYTPTGTAPWPEAELAKLKMPAHFIVMNKPLAPIVAGHESRR